MGGMTWDRFAGRPQVRMPQWSPPVMGGMTREAAYRQRPEVRPPWSQPVMGGMTVTGDQAHGGDCAAMEPARNGRDDGGVPGDRVVIASRPQWSPPVMGGMTAGVIDPPSQVQVPQWSPPVMGGMTVRRSGVPWQAHHGRNGARP